MEKAFRRIRPSVRLHSGALTLADWLHFSWFYPEGFICEQILETDRAWVVLGNGIAYKFLKSSDLPGSPAMDRWRRSCRELEDNAPLAGQVYLGLRCLQEEEGEYLWESRARAVPIRPLKMPANIQDAALVLRRLRREERLDVRLKEGRRSPLALAGLVGERLAAFHAAEREKPAPFGSASQCVDRIEQEYLEPLRASLLRPELEHDRLLRRSIEELASCTARFFSENSRLLFERHAQHFVIDAHRAVFARNVFVLEEEIDNRREAVIIGRPPGEDGERIADLLADVASFSVDLESQEETGCAERFEERYFSRFPESYDPEVYAFYRAGACIALLRRALFSEAQEGDPMERSERLLALALRMTHGLQRPALVVVHGFGAEQHGVSATQLATGLAGLLGAELVEEKSALPDFLPLPLTPDLLTERLLEQSRPALEAGKLVIVACENFSWMCAEHFAALFRGIPCFRSIVGPVRTIREAQPFLPEQVSGTGRDAPAGNGSSPESADAPAVCELAFLSDSFTLLEQLFLILRELRFAVSRQGSLRCAPKVCGSESSAAGADE